MANIENNWYALYTKSRYEKKTGILLTEMGYEVYVPLVKTLKQWSDRKKKVEEPLFRSYIFVKTTPKQFHWIRGVIGAVYIVSFNREPAVIPDEQIENLKLLLSSGESFDFSDEKFLPGDMVEVTHGSLRGIKGTIVDVRGKKHLLIRVDAINQNLVINVPPGLITRVKK